MTYDKTFTRLEERLLNACDKRIQALNDIGWFGDSESIAEIKDSDLKELATVLNMLGYTSVKDVIDNMIWTIYNDLDIGTDLPNVYYDIVIDSVLGDGIFHLEPVISLHVSYNDNGKYALWTVKQKFVMPHKISLKCLDTLNYTDRVYLLNHTFDEAGDGDRKPMDDYVYKHITDYDIIIKIDMFGNITYHPCNE